MSELNRDQIVKAMQDCIDRPKCIDCPNLTLCAGNGFEYLLVKAVELIKELTEENAEVKANWQKLKESHERACEKCRAEFKRLTEENERLSTTIVMQEEEVESLKDSNKHLVVFLKEKKADTVRKMQKALEDRIHSKLSYHGWYLKETVIAEIAKEILEGVK